MTRNLKKRIEEVLDTKVRPQLAMHSGNIEVVEFKDDVLKVRFLGKCSHCPSSYVTLENVVSDAVLEAIPEIKEVSLVTGVSNSLIDLANSMLKERSEKREREKMGDKE